ncbi:hypothetical protein [Streptomyces sp. NPDC005004]
MANRVGDGRALVSWLDPVASALFAVPGSSDALREVRARRTVRADFSAEAVLAHPYGRAGTKSIA